MWIGAALLFCATLAQGAIIPVNTNITSDTTWYSDNTYNLNAQIRVTSGATLTIQAGTMIKGAKMDAGGKASALIIMQGAKIMAQGTKANPITFTTQETVTDVNVRGLWGGVILAGFGVITNGPGRTNTVEGLTGVIYGGSDNNDNSGVMQYVRIWHGGADVSPTGNPENSGNEINGLTLAGVGAATTIEHVEVAFNLDDGFEMFGGAVNLKWCSSIFNGDDAFDTDEGYVGKMQFIFALVDNNGNHATEMDSKINKQPRSFPQVYSATFIRSSNNSKDPNDGLMRLREGTGGRFGNMILMGTAGSGIQNADCGNETRSSTDSTTGIPNLLYVSQNNIINTKNIGGQTVQFNLSCSESPTWPSPSAVALDPGLQLVPNQWNTHLDILQIDPRPVTGGNSFSSPDTPPADGFFTTTTYKGAFGTNDLWIDGWSYLSENALLPDGSNLPTTANTLAATISTSMTLRADTTYYLTRQTFVNPGVTLTIEAGTTIKAYRQDADGSAPTLVIEQGAMIMAEGSASNPITFTSVLPDAVLPRKGTWGGLIILGFGRITGSGTSSIEGLPVGVGTYGGLNDADNSGTLKYVRVWYGGADIGFDTSNPENSGNEINGITFGGVGSGTTLENVEVAFNKDDGFEFFGGAVNGKWLSSIFVDDDAFDTDEGYQGKLQFIFALVDKDGDHAAEMDSKNDMGRRSHPQVWGATFIKANHTTGTSNGLIQIREGGGGTFRNMILTGRSGSGLENNLCFSETRTSDVLALPGLTFPDYLFWDPNNIVNTIDPITLTTSQFDLAVASPDNCNWASGPSSVNVDPQLQSVPGFWTSSSDLNQIDPRPLASGNAFSSVSTPTDSFFTTTTYTGAFGTNLWLDKWSWLSASGLLPDGSVQPTASNTISGIITADTTLSASTTYYMTQQVFVKAPATLTIEAGTTIKSYRQDVNGKAPTLVIEQGAKIMAAGTSSKPITFTSVLPEANLPTRGTWGGLIILGRGIITGGPGTTADIEGLDAGLGTYGGLDASDNSGVLKYVRVWYGGADISPDPSDPENSGNEINGITFGAVGSGTTLENVEVAFNKDDGFEFFGGSVNGKWLSSLFVDDDAFDTDQGYQGKLQFIFALVDKDGDHAAEMDSKDNTQPRSYPQVSGATFIKAGHAFGTRNGLIQIREGGGGNFQNMILTGSAGFGLENNMCGTEAHSSSRTLTFPDSLYWDRNNIVNTVSQISNTVQQFSVEVGCVWDALDPRSRNVDPNLQLVPNTWSTVSDLFQIDPRPIERGSAFTNVTTNPDSFFTATNYQGAFGSTLWLDKWSYLSAYGLIPDGSVVPTLSNTLPRTISTSFTIPTGSEYYLTQQTFVMSPAILTIEEGATIKAYRQDANGKAPTLVIEQGAQINAVGTAENPITFTSVLPPSLLPMKGTWGGLILLGNAFITGGSVANIEGLDIGLGTYGGSNDADSSGTLRYVRVWYGGADIGFDNNNPENSGNEINGITFGAVGSGTTVEYVEVAYNKDDGFEFFGGAVNCRYLSALFVDDDAFDTDEGYQGKLQFIFALVDKDGDHAAEMDSKDNLQRRSFPRVNGATFIKSGHSTGLTNGLIQIREGGGGEFTNMVLTGKAGAGLENNQCGTETRSSALAGTFPNYLLWSSNNVINTVTADTSTLNQFSLSVDCTWASGPSSLTVDPQLILSPNQWTSESDLFQIDPRPLPAGNSFSNLDATSDSFFMSVNYKGAFGSSLWLDKWSYLSMRGLIPDGSVVPTTSTILAADISSSITLKNSNTYYMTQQVFVKSGATLTIEAGTTIKSYRQDASGKAPTLVIEQGAMIQAVGTASSPITFTSVLPSANLPQRGTWGGLIILGRAVITGTGSSTNDIEGLAAGLGTYGGNNDADNSGTLKYVRVWYGGADIGFDPTNPENSGNEINGITFGGVGSGTTLENVEVAFNKDDGFEFFGGSVNGKWLSSLFVDDDAFDSDEGYQGKLQFIFALVDQDGDHAAEMDSKNDDQRRSFPKVSGATFIKSGHSSGRDNGLIQIREGGGGEFYNMILTGKAGAGLENNNCFTETRTSTLTSIGTAPNYLYWSPNNIINTVRADTGVANQFKIASASPDNCVWTSGDPTSRTVDPNLQLVPFVWTTVSDLKQIDPRPVESGNAFSGVDAISDSFFTSTTYSGAFGTNMWLDGWSYLSENGLVPSADVLPTAANTLPSSITASMNLNADTTYYMTQQVFVKAPAVLTIPAGTTIKAYRQDANGKAPTLVIEQGAQIIAEGTKTSPITFTSVLPSSSLPVRGAWGGLIILGRAPITTSSASITDDIEGLAAGLGTYGGTDTNDNSGSLKYVRVWYGGADIGFDTSNPENSGNEINGITFGGVGQGTTLENIEVAFNKDDGFEFFGGSVNAKWLSALFVDDDAFDTDEGYNGKLQFLFALVDQDGDHAAEMDSKNDASPRSFPIVSGATFIKSDHRSGRSNGLIQIREGGGGEFYNMVLTGKAGAGLENNDCAMETRTSDISLAGTAPDYLFWHPNNIVNTITSGAGTLNQFKIASSAPDNCIWANGPTSRSVDPNLILLPNTWTTYSNLNQIDPRPVSGGNALDASLAIGSSNSFFSSAAYSGAFGTDLWIDGWSWLSVNGLLPSGDVKPTTSTTLSSSITSNLTLFAGGTYYMTQQVFVKSPAVLTIEPGVIVKSYRQDASGKAPTLVIEQGAKIIAAGTVDDPITFTSVLPDSVLPKRGTWGGLIILGRGILSGTGSPQTNNIEGLDAGLGLYGGSDDTESSGILRYVRVWYGGADISPDPNNPENSGNEINGITFGGVGSGTTLEYVEVAYNKDDGFEFFGGSVSGKYLSSLFVDDDAFDTDEGYQGKLQFIFALVDKDGDHAAEMDANNDVQRRSFPQVNGATFIKSSHSTGRSNGLIQIREGGGGSFTNMVLTGKAGAGLENNACAAETHTSTGSLGTIPDYLFWSPNNIINTKVTDTGAATQFAISTDCVWSAGDPQSLSLDPQLLLSPDQWTTESNLFQIDPRPTPGGNSFSNLDTTSDPFFTTVTSKGAFGSNLWLDKWSYLSMRGLLPDGSVVPTTSTIIPSSITTDTRLTSSNIYYMTQQVFVKSPAVLTIEPGTTIKSYRQDNNGKAPTLVIEQGAKIMAAGTASKPITFTSVLPTSQLPQRGTWGGLIILGNAVISGPGTPQTNDIEGLTAGLGTYGGANDADDSGVLQYVRVWYGGADISPDPTNPENSGNEINGITFGGVGSGTTVDHVEVAFNKDDGFEFFGGAVNAKWLSALFVDDDAFDSDEGYQGKLQFIFALVDKDGDHAAEMDSKDDVGRRSFPKVSGATFIKSGHSTGRGNGLVQIREGGGGEFYNMVLTGKAGAGLENNNCFSETRTSTLTSIGTAPNYLYWSSNNIINTVRADTGVANQFKIASASPDNCVWQPIGDPTSRSVDPNLLLLPSVWTSVSDLVQIDPRPVDSGNSFSGVDTITDSFFTTTTYSGAFGTDMWLDGWSYLSENGLVPSADVKPTLSNTIASSITTNVTLNAETTYYMTQQVFVKAPAILTIEAGTTIKSYRQDANGKAPTLVIEQGAKIIAEGTKALPITFTSVLPASLLPIRGAWGGLIILGRAPITTSSASITDDIEGLAAGLGTYGGTDPNDNSGSLKYVRVWYGGADIGFDTSNPENSGNEINGITFGGVGQGTTLENIEVAFNKDDGFEFFGGNVNAKWLSALFVDDDAFDTDEGYNGKLQFLFALVDKDGDHAAEMDSKNDASPRSFPIVSGATFIKSDHSSGRSNGLIQIREGGGGEFYNMILTGKAGAGLENNQCGAETRTSDISVAGTAPDYLYWDSNNIVNTVLAGAGTLSQFKIASSAPDNCVWTSGPTSRNVDPNLILLPNSWSTSANLNQIDPRPLSGGNALDASLANGPSDSFFSTAAYSGAFDSNLWIDGWSWLSVNGLLPSGDVQPTSSTVLSSSITTNTTLLAGNTYYMTQQVFVRSPAILTVQPGVTIRSYRQDAGGKAPTLVIEQGAKIMAEGTADSPITFTSVLPDSVLPMRGTWGGLIILGRGIISGTGTPQTNNIEGLDAGLGQYGGADNADSSGSLRYVRVWYGGADISPDPTNPENSGNEINGITFGGVGSGTTLEYVEVAYNKDDGFEFFGGSVNGKYLSALFVDDDAFDSDEGYQGKLQFIFALVDQDGDHAAEMDAKFEVQPRSFPQVSGATFIKSDHTSGRTNGLIQIREGGGGSFTNIILTGLAGAGLENNACSSETKTSTGAVGTAPDYLFWSPNNVVNTITADTGVLSQFKISGDCTWTPADPQSLSLDPQLLLAPLRWTTESNLLQIDPRPTPGGNSFSNLDTLTDSFFTSVTWKGAFGSNLWLDKWSYLSMRGLLPDGSVVPTAATIIPSSITTSTTLSASNTYYMTQQVFVKSPAVLTIEPGTTIKSYRQDNNGKAPTLVIEQGAKIMAAGTASKPITFTSVLPTSQLPQRGTWGGLIILGNAVISGPGTPQTNDIEGLTAGLGTYGGANDADDSGVLQYVRVWYGGADISPDPTNPENSGNEINGITFGGVGSGTTVDHVEVAFNKDDGFEFFGGAVNAKWLSALFVDDDAFDTDEGYQGKLQFLFALVDKDGDHAAEMDSKNDLQRRSYPKVSGVTFIKADHTTGESNGLIQIREGGGGEFYNMILTGKAGAGLENNKCFAEVRTGTLTEISAPNSLYWSPNNIINTVRADNGVSNQFSISIGAPDNCVWSAGSPSSRAVDPGLQLIPNKWTGVSDINQLDPRLAPSSTAFTSFDTISDSFFTPTTYSGAFGSDLWLDGWSYLSENALLPDGSVVPTASNIIPSVITADTTLDASTNWLMVSQVFVKPGATLFIQEGTTIKSYRQDNNGKAPTLVIERGAKIMASGSPSRPITFTSVLPEAVLPMRGTWGGLIVLGNGIITGGAGTTNSIEGLAAGDGVYGGSDNADNSGVMRYIRVWYGGADISPDPSNPENSGNEINGITFGGVGSGTTLEYCEVAFNKDDGFEFFGGAVNGKYLSTLFADDDAFDTDEGYQGKLQFIFALVDKDGDHAAEMDSKNDNAPRSFPTVYGATFIKSDHTTGRSNGLVQIREGGGGAFYNMILTGKAGAGLENNLCKSETRSSTVTGTFPDYLYWDQNNIINTVRADNAALSQFKIASGTPDNCVWTPLSRSVDPNLILLPNTWTTSSDLGFFDPRPLPDGNAFSSVSSPTDAFFTSTDYAGAFGSTMWLGQWSYLSVQGLIPDNTVRPTSGTILSSSITSNTTLSSANTYYMTSQVFVKAPAVLTIQAGTTIKSYKQGADGKAPALVIERGAKIIADGTADKPITFTTAIPSQFLPMRGAWGGLILLGNGVVNGPPGTERNIEGLDAGLGTYGGTDDTDNSGILRYVRVWYGGADINPDPTNPENSGNEINGITFGGVGSGTTVENVEVAFNKDDGFEFFGGAVNGKWLSSLFVDDDAFDTDQGYRGKLQFIFALVDKDGDHAAEMDANNDVDRRSFPTVSGATFIKSDHTTGTSNGLIQIREGGGGEFYNMILAGSAGAGLEHNACASESHTSTPATRDGLTAQNYLYWSSKNMISTLTPDTKALSQFKISGCTWTPAGDPTSSNLAPELQLLPRSWTSVSDIKMIDPRPKSDTGTTSNIFTDIENPTDSFFTSTSYKGAFGSSMWLDKWSYLSVNGLIPAGDVTPSTTNVLCGTITADTTLNNLITYIMTCQVFVQAPAVLTIPAGTTIRSYAQNANGTAPALVIERGAKLMASGTPAFPITFTNVANPASNPKRGTWGGLILLGNGVTSKTGGTNDVEGLPTGLGTYGGTDNTDSSGVLRYVRVWYGGADIGLDTSNPQNSGNEINGITFAGVGSGTVVENCEVAYNLDDGFEFFGGAVNIQRCSSIFNKDDAFDTDEGYQGKMQYIFALVDTDGNHAVEMDSKTNGNINSSPRSFPQVYGATFIKAGHATKDGLMRLREGTGGRFGNIILSGNAKFSLQNTDCGTETRSSTDIGTPPDTLFFSANNLLFTRDSFGNISPISQDSSCTGTLTGTNTDPQLLLIPAAWEQTVNQLDPRPVQGGPAYTTTLDVPPADGFFAAPTFKGAFGSDLWLDKFSWLSDNGKLPDNAAYPSPATTLCGDITASITLTQTQSPYFMTCQVFVKSPAVLTIEKGVTIKSYLEDTNGKAPVLVIEQGAKIMAVGTKTEPITFTSVLPSRGLPARGTWGGIIILGSATTAKGTNTIEGLTAPNGNYGGAIDTDNSGTMRYVRIWYGGADISPDPSNPENSGNEINGLTLGGVGSGTKLEFIEVAYNLDDGFEWFGGTVNAKFLSSIFNGDDQFDMDEGYRGQLEFLFGLTGSVGNHAIECDSKTNGDLDSSPRTNVQIVHSTFIGDPFSTDAVLRFREGSAGVLATSIVSGKFNGIQRKDCSVSQTNMDSSILPSTTNPAAFYFDPYNIVDAPTQFLYDSSCGASSPVRANSTLTLRLLPNTPTDNSAMFDPRPMTSSAGSGYPTRPADAWVLNAVTGLPPYSSTAGVFSLQDYVGAFGQDLWTSGWSLLSESGKLPDNEYSDNILCGEITTDTTISGVWFMTCQVFVKNGATLTIQAGTTVKAYAIDAAGTAPALIITAGSKIMAAGAKNNAITFTSVRPASTLPARGTWGGLIILGNAPIAPAGTSNIEGIPVTPDSQYGGNVADDNSGKLSYVRVWYGGADISSGGVIENSGNEINGITFGGVGSGTTLEFCEVAHNLDDGFEFFGGTVNGRYLSSIFVGDDSFDTDQGYQGKLQFIYAMVGQNGQHAAEMDSKLTDVQPRSFPQVYGATFIGGAPDNLKGNDAIMRLREGTGGQFANMILSNAAQSGVINADCTAEIRTNTLATPGLTFPNYLWFSSNNIVWDSGTNGFTQFDLSASCTPWASGPSAINLNPQYRSIPLDLDESSVVNTFDPRPDSCGAAYNNVDAIPVGDTFLVSTTYKGAFGSTNWLDGLSLMSENNYLNPQCVPAECIPGGSSTVCGSLTFATIDCTSSLAQTIAADTKAALATASGRPASSVFTTINCGSTIVEYSVAFPSNPVASAFANNLVSNTASTLGASLVSKYGTPVATGFVSNSPGFSPTPSPTLSGGRTLSPTSGPVVQSPTVSPTTANAGGKEDNNDDLTAQRDGLAAGFAIVSILLLLVLGALVFIYCMRRKRRHPPRGAKKMDDELEGDSLQMAGGQTMEEASLSEQPTDGKVGGMAAV